MTKNQLANCTESRAIIRGIGIRVDSDGNTFIQSAGFTSGQAQECDGFLAAGNLGMIATLWTVPTRWIPPAAAFTSSWQA